MLLRTDQLNSRYNCFVIGSGPAGLTVALELAKANKRVLVFESGESTATGRPKDLDDVTSLWRLHRAVLDADEIRSMLRLLEEALSQSDLLPAFNAIAGE